MENCFINIDLKRQKGKNHKRNIYDYKQENYDFIIFLYTNVIYIKTYIIEETSKANLPEWGIWITKETNHNE